jgi:tetratricopeptide (TPR) repeat protein
MAEQNEANTAKKRRVIHWNPDAGREQVSRRWTWKRIVGWSVGGFFGLMILLGLINRAPKLFVGKTVVEIIATRGEEKSPALSVQDANSAFISQAKAEQMQEIVNKQFVEIQRLPTSHPVQMQQLILLETKLREGQSLVRSHDFAQAYQVLDALNRDIKAFAENVKVQGEARKAYDAILLRIKDLEPARTLAPGTLEAAFESAGAGRQLLNDGNFSGAKGVFDRGFAELNKAQNALNDFVRDNLIAGKKALTKGEKEEAKKAFSAALEKAPGNEEATTGLKRAENIDRVYALLQQGEKFEKEARYAEAAESYKKAFELDKFSAIAQEGQARAARLEKETKFASAKTAAEQAFKSKEWAKAITEFQNALKVYPNKPDVTAQLKLAKENAHKDAVQKALAKGFAFEKAYQWREARDAYKETLDLEPEQAEAKQGYMQAGTVLRALLAYEKKIEMAEQLANKAEFRAALNQFNDAMNVKPAYLEASERVLQLRNLLQQQSQPVDVTFRSDGNTWVSITNFKAPQKIENALTIKIMPGDYEIIGRRKGYRDVIMQLQVRAGTPPPVVTVACNIAADR